MNEYICDIFKDKYNVMRAFNGEEAYKMLSKRIPDIIVSDIMMPKVDGLEFTKLVKQDVSTSHIPVILLTAKTDEKDHTEGYKCGAEAYIAKPFNAQNLELLIENIQSYLRLFFQISICLIVKLSKFYSFYHFTWIVTIVVRVYMHF
jgi:DNA-binding response OmpR family regulator